MNKFLIGVTTAALWFALSHAANAERIYHDHSFDAGAPAGDVVIHR